jgi:hypothetical protein
MVWWGVANGRQESTLTTPADDTRASAVAKMKHFFACLRILHDPQS